MPTGHNTFISKKAAACLTPEFYASVGVEVSERGSTSVHLTEVDTIGTAGTNFGIAAVYQALSTRKSRAARATARAVGGKRCRAGLSGHKSVKVPAHELHCGDRIDTGLIVGKRTVSVDGVLYVNLRVRDAHMVVGEACYEATNQVWVKLAP